MSDQDFLDEPETESTRISSHCESCDWRGDRAATFVARPGQIPAFDDRCLKCQSTDITVSAPKYIPTKRGNS